MRNVDEKDLVLLHISIYFHSLFDEKVKKKRNQWSKKKKTLTCTKGHGQDVWRIVRRPSFHRLFFLFWRCFFPPWPIALGPLVSPAPLRDCFLSFMDLSTATHAVTPSSPPTETKRGGGGAAAVKEQRRRNLCFTFLTPPSFFFLCSVCLLAFILCPIVRDKKKDMETQTRLSPNICI